MRSCLYSSCIFRIKPVQKGPLPAYLCLSACPCVSSPAATLQCDPRFARHLLCCRHWQTACSETYVVRLYALLASAEFMELMDSMCRYSFDHGPIHYLAYSTELDYAAGSAQNA